MPLAVPWLVLRGALTLIGTLEGEAPHHRLDVGGETVEIGGAIEAATPFREPAADLGELVRRLREAILRRDIAVPLGIVLTLRAFGGLVVMGAARPDSRRR